MTVTPITRIQHIDHRIELGRTKRLKSGRRRDLGATTGGAGSLPFLERELQTDNQPQKFLSKCDYAVGAKNRKCGFVSERRVDRLILFSLLTRLNLCYLPRFHVVPRRARARKD